MSELLICNQQVTRSIRVAGTILSLEPQGISGYNLAVTNLPKMGTPAEPRDASGPRLPNTSRSDVREAF